MARFLSDEWVSAFNAALREVPLVDVPTGTSVRAESGTFIVEERVSDLPGRSDAEGPFRVVLRVEDGKMTLAAGENQESQADVVVTLSYDDAAALARGELDPTQALGAGRVQVRGDLSVLVAGHHLLAAATGHLGSLQADTTY